jgi:hypothetical protein
MKRFQFLYKSPAPASCLLPPAIRVQKYLINWRVSGIIDMNFSLTPEQIAKFKTWSKQFETIYAGAAGGAFTFSFTHTGLCTVAKVSHFQGQSIDLTEYDNM